MDWNTDNDYELTNVPSWESALTPQERLGGPSATGNSFWGDFKVCPYKHNFVWRKRMRPTKPQYELEVGGLFHEVVARYYAEDVGGGQGKRGIDKANELLDKAEQITPAVAGHVRTLWAGWLELYGPGSPLDDRADVYAVEQLLGVKRPFPYTTRLDRWFWSDKLNGPVIVEVKTAARADERLLTSYRMDSQFMGQMWLWKKCMSKEYGDLRGYMVDLIVKNRVPKYLREEIAVDYRLIRGWEASMRYMYEEYLSCQARNKWPRRIAWTCRYCALFGHCASGGRNTEGWFRESGRKS